MQDKANAKMRPCRQCLEEGRTDRAGDDALKIFDAQF